MTLEVSRSRCLLLFIDWLFLRRNFEKYDDSLSHVILSTSWLIQIIDQSRTLQKMSLARDENHAPLFVTPSCAKDSPTFLASQFSR